MKTKNSFKLLFLLTSLLISLFFAGCGGGSSNGNPPNDGPSNGNGDFNVRAVALSSSSIKITWTPQSDAKTYWVFYSTKANPASSDLFMIYSGTNMTYTMNGLNAGTTYYFRVYINDLSGSYKQVSATTLSDTSGGGDGAITIYNYTIYKDDPITNVTVFDSSNQKVFEYKNKYIYWDEILDIDVPAGTYRVEIEDDYDTGTFVSTSFTVSNDNVNVYVTYTGDGLIVTGGISASDVQGIYETYANLGNGNASYWAFLTSDKTYFVESDDEIVETGEYTVNGSTVTFFSDGGDVHTGTYSAATQKMTAYGSSWEKWSAMPF